MTVLTLIHFVCLIGFVQSATYRRYSCIHCRDATSLHECTTIHCSSGPECYMHITKDATGATGTQRHLRINAGCTTRTSCVNMAWNPKPHDSSLLCDACCVDGNLCVPDQCNQQLNEKIPEFRLDHGISCEVCTGGNCGVFPDQDPVLQCPDELPNCMNIVTNEADGNKQFTKLCASNVDCDKLWWDETSQRPECLNFDPSNIYTSAFECSYCCLTSQCNRRIVPDNDTLYIGSPK